MGVFGVTVLFGAALTSSTSNGVLAKPSLHNFKAYYINLPGATERRLHMEQQIESTQLPAQRFPAVSHDDVARGNFDDVVVAQGLSDFMVTRDGESANYTVACYLSHLQALHQASLGLEPDQVALIMEDDVSIPEDWLHQLQAVLLAAPEDWQLIKVCGWGDVRSEDLVKPNAAWAKAVDMVESGMISPEHSDIPNLDFYALRDPFEDPGILWTKYYYAGSGGYIVRGSSIQAVLRHLRSQPIKDADGMLLSNGTLASYDVEPHPFRLDTDHLLSTSGFHSTRRRQIMKWIFGDDQEADASMKKEMWKPVTRTQLRGP